MQSENHSINGRNCPLCNKKLHLIYFDGDFPPIPPDESFCGELDKDGWQYCFRESIWRKIVRKTKHFIIYVQSKISDLPDTRLYPKVAYQQNPTA